MILYSFKCATMLSVYMAQVIHGTVYTKDKASNKYMNFLKKVVQKGT